MEAEYIDKAKKDGTALQRIELKNFGDLKEYVGKIDNFTVHKRYIWHDERIHEHISPNLSLEEKAWKAFELIDIYRTQARELMADHEKSTEQDF